MCLDRQTRVDEFPENGIGYKVFIKLDAISYESVFRSQIVIRDYEYIASKDLIYDGNDLTYPSGFHIYPHLNAAEILFQGFSRAQPLKRYAIVQVSYRERHTCGTEDGYPVIVANYMKLLKEINHGKDMQSSN